MISTADAVRSRPSGSIAIGHHNLAIDFESALWPAGHRGLAGLTPYASPHSSAATHGFAFVYLTLMWPAVINGWQTANVSLPLAFGTASAWRSRNRPLIARLTVGVIVSIILRAAQRRPSTANRTPSGFDRGTPPVSLDFQGL